MINCYVLQPLGLYLLWKTVCMCVRGHIVTCLCIPAKMDWRSWFLECHWGPSLKQVNTLKGRCTTQTRVGWLLMAIIQPKKFPMENLRANRIRRRRCYFLPRRCELLEKVREDLPSGNQLPFLPLCLGSCKFEKWSPQEHPSSWMCQLQLLRPGVSQISCVGNSMRALQGAKLQGEKKRYKLPCI